jgi:hypothetical protein
MLTITGASDFRLNTKMAEFEADFAKKLALLEENQKNYLSMVIANCLLEFI